MSLSRVPLGGEVPHPEWDTGPDRCDHIVRALTHTGWCLTDGFLAPSLVADLRREALDQRRTGGFHRAGVGRGRGHQVRPEIRADEILWLDAGNCSAAQGVFLSRIESLRQALNRALFLGLIEFEGHLAVYAPGGFYRRHLDRLRGVEARTVTCVCYLNDAWCAADGGQLRLYADPEDPERATDVLPQGGRLVTFFSADLPHEVLPARRERVSVTGWLKRRGAG
jgi:SM-20-related protein